MGMTRKDWKKMAVGVGFLAPNVLGFLAFTLIPLLMSVYMAFTDWNLEMHNYFRSAGAAVLIEGDTELWFESGAVGNVVIRDNLFEDCYTSGNNLIDAPWGWGEGVISISPSFRPADETTPAYHRNIRIKRNTFRHFDYAVLFARSVEGLTFSRNTLERTRTFKPFYRPWNLCLDGCRKVRIGRNRLSPDFPGRNIRIDHMRASEIIQPGARTFEIFHKQTDR